MSVIHGADHACDCPAEGFLRWSLLVLLLLFSRVVDAACTVTDATGHSIHLDRPAHRIISLAPDITEDLFAAGAGKNIVGVVRGSDYPAAAARLPQVGTYAGLDLERVVSLHPDLIVNWGGSFSRQLSALKAFHIPVYTTHPQRVEDVPRILRDLGCLAGTEATADSAATQFTRSLSAWRDQRRGRQPVTVFFQLGGYSLMTVNRESWINQVIRMCGGRNVFADARWAAPVIAEEAVVVANPDVILSTSAETGWTRRWKRWPQLSAVKHQRLYALHPDWIERAGPRLVLGVDEICRRIQSAI